MSIPIKKCKICNEEFSKIQTVSNKVWKTKTMFCSVKCAAKSRGNANKGENHYNWKGGFDYKKYLALHPEIYEARKQVNKDREREKRLMVLRYYSKSEIPFCICCKEKEFKFLAIDHVNNDGAKHRKEMGTKKSRMVDWLIKNNFPSGFQVLCHNCNMAKGFYGICPHKLFIAVKPIA